MPNALTPKWLKKVISFFFSFFFFLFLILHAQVIILDLCSCLCSSPSRNHYHQHSSCVNTTNYNNSKNNNNLDRHRVLLCIHNQPSHVYFHIQLGAHPCATLDSQSSFNTSQPQSKDIHVSSFLSCIYLVSFHGFVGSYLLHGRIKVWSNASSLLAFNSKDYRWHEPCA